MLKKTGIVLLNYNSEKDIFRLIKELSGIENISIVVIDNSDKINERLDSIEKNDNYNYIFNNKNIGYYKGNLIGVKYFYKKYGINEILILNPDVGANNWIEIISKLKEKILENQAFIVGPKIKIPNFDDVSSPRPKFRPLKEIIYNFCFPISYIFLKRKQKNLSNKNGKVFAVEGSAYMVDAKKMIDIEEYFQNIFLYSEEIIFGLLAEKNEWDIYFDNSIEVLHYHSPRKESKIYDKFSLESMKEICDLFHINKIIKNLLIFSIGYKKNIKKIFLKIKDRRFFK